MSNAEDDAQHQLNAKEDKSQASSRIIGATIIGIIFIIVLLLLALFIPTPSGFQYEIFRVVLALAAAAFAAILPGAISAKLPWGIGAVGSLAVFSIVYFFSPAQLIAKTAKAETINAAKIPITNSDCVNKFQETGVFCRSLSDPRNTDSTSVPRIVRVSGAIGGNRMTVYFSEGIHGSGDGALQPANFRFSNGRGARIVGVDHEAGSESAALTLSNPLSADDDICVTLVQTDSLDVNGETAKPKDVTETPLGDSSNRAIALVLKKPPFYPRHC